MGTPETAVFRHEIKSGSFSSIAGPLLRILEDPSPTTAGCHALLLHLWPGRQGCPCSTTDQALTSLTRAPLGSTYRLGEGDRYTELT